jgi:pimeloyl-ACP methyl ester carboxylesterase
MASVMSDPEVESTTLIPPVSPLGYPTNLLAPGQTYETVNATIADIPLKRAPGLWWVGFIIASLLLLMFLVAVTWLFIKGVGIWGVNIPVAVSVFPDELYSPPRSWAEEAYPNLVHFNKVAKGGHFAAWEQPTIFTEELRAGFKSLRG